MKKKRKKSIRRKSKNKKKSYKSKSNKKLKKKSYKKRTNSKKKIKNFKRKILRKNNKSEILKKNKSGIILNIIRLQNKFKDNFSFKFSFNFLKIDQAIQSFFQRLDDKIIEMINTDRPVIFDCRVDKQENCFPMIPSGKPHNQMLLGPKDQKQNKITGKGKTLV